MKHYSVLKKEVMTSLDIKSDGTYLDVTLGSGGHSLEIVEHLSTNGKLIGLDADITYLATVEKLLTDNSVARVIVKRSNFADVKEVAEELDIVEFDGILADLGWSSDQLTSLEGLSYMNEHHELDMRLDKEKQVKAKDLVNALGKSELETLFGRYADFGKRQAKQLTTNILNARKQEPIQTVGQLNRIVEKQFGEDKQKLGRIYQALRIAVNDEYNNLKTLIHNGVELLRKNGRIAIITFHSGEEVVVRSEFDALVSSSNAMYVLPKMFIQPRVEELKENIRSRSAKLWVLEKL